MTVETQTVFTYRITTAQEWMRWLSSSQIVYTGPRSVKKENICQYDAERESPADGKKQVINGSINLFMTVTVYRFCASQHLPVVQLEVTSNNRGVRYR